jgi:hypothetical protein
MYGTKSYDEAVELAERASRLGWVPGFISEDRKRLVAYEVRAHSWVPGTGIPATWGVYPRWTYSEGVTEGDVLRHWFGGPFVVLDQIRVLEKADG